MAPRGAACIREGEEPSNGNHSSSKLPLLQLPLQASSTLIIQVPVTLSRYHIITPKPHKMCYRCATTVSKACQAVRPTLQTAPRQARLIHNTSFRPYKGTPMTVAQAAQHNKAGMAGVGAVTGALLVATGTAKLMKQVEENSMAGGRDRNGVKAYLARKNGQLV